jgi:hypothetical protein
MAPRSRVEQLHQRHSRPLAATEDEGVAAAAVAGTEPTELSLVSIAEAMVSMAQVTVATPPRRKTIIDGPDGC